MDIIKLLDVNGGSSTVKALCFHPKNSWIFLGLSTGMIRIWNYYTNTMLKEFGGHKGSVQSGDMNISCPLFVSAGCDGKIKLWDYCDNTSNITNTIVLEGHEASVNDVKFHFELPWIVSASHDHTVRIWNWKSCCCIAVLAKHTDVVTSSSFHPKKDLVLSSSLDGTLCVWDFGGLRDDTIWHKFVGFSLSKRARLQNVLRGHKSGVAHAIFHPTLLIIFSSSCDGSVYSWQMKGKTEKSFHHELLHLRRKEFSPLTYATKLNAIMYAEDDGNMCLFDAGSETGRQNAGFYVHHKKLFSLCSHPTKHLFAVSHADGISIYRIMKVPLGFATTKHNIYYLKDRRLWSYYFWRNKSSSDVILGPTEDLPGQTLRPTVSTISCSTRGIYCLICVENTTYILVIANNRTTTEDFARFALVLATGHCLSAVLVTTNRFAVLTQSGAEKILSLRNTSNKVVFKTVLPCDIQALFSNNSFCNLLLCKAADRVVMYDMRQGIVVSELSISSVHNIFWEAVGKEDDSVIAFVGKHFITIANEKLEVLCTIDEATNRIESGAWDDVNKGVFVYKTLNDIRYFLTDGQSGTIVTCNEPLYITKVSGNTIYGLDEHGEIHIIHVDATEYIIKSSILNKDYMKQCCLGLNLLIT